jgi:hypothetical protein
MYLANRALASKTQRQCYDKLITYEQPRFERQ